MNLDSKRRIQLSVGITIFVLAVSFSYFFGIDEDSQIAKHDIYMVLDVSGSMIEPPSKFIAAKNAAQEFVNTLQLTSSSNFRVGLIVFETNVHTIIELTNDQTKLNNAISELQAGGNTSMGEAIKEATEKLTKQGRADVKKTILLLSDGKSNEGISPTSAAKTAKTNDISIFSVGYGDEADTITLQLVSFLTGGQSYKAITGEELVSTFNDIASDLVSPVVQYSARLMILFAIPIILFIPAIEKGLTTIIGRSESIPSCSKCGFLNKASSKFCAKCGNSMRSK